MSEKNRRAVEFALQVRATHGALVTAELLAGRSVEPVTLEILSTVDQVMRGAEARQLAEACSTGAMQAVGSMMGR